MKKFYVIKGLRMAEEIIRRGHNIHKIEDDERNSYFKVFIFEDTPQFRTDFTEISNRRRIENSK